MVRKQALLDDCEHDSQPNGSRCRVRFLELMVQTREGYEERSTGFWVSEKGYE